MDKLLKRIKLVNKYENINNAKRLDSPKQVSIEEEKKRKNASATIHMFKQVHDQLKNKEHDYEDVDKEYESDESIQRLMQRKNEKVEQIKLFNLTKAQIATLTLK